MAELIERPRAVLTIPRWRGGMVRAFDALPGLSARLMQLWMKDARRRQREPEDVGVHTVCVEVTAEFLAFSKARGNDLSTARPEFGYPGLSPGDRWCLCAARWQEALDAGAAPRVVLAATHEATLEIVQLGDLKRHALDLA